MRAALKKLSAGFFEETPLDYSLVEVRQSAVEGRGTYAVQDIDGRAFVCSLSGKLIPSSEALASDYNRMALQIDDHWWLEEMGFPDDFINHSCEPNVKFSENGRGFVSLRPIQKGEELFFDYSTSLYDGGWSLACGCGAKSCRGFIMGFADLQKEDQQRILGNCLPYIQEKHE